jgi:PAS domain S-box-containing protein
MKLLNHVWVEHAKFDRMKIELAAKKAQMSAALAFVKAITQGNLDTEFKAAADDGAESELSASLVGMRDQMKRISMEEKQRHWVTEGLAMFGEILRQKNNNLSTLADTIISNLVKYMGANQGALYLINDEKSTDVFIEMAACYAYGRKKHLDRRIEMGSGLIGQVALEKSTLHMSSIPQDYIKITSGLGEALPRNLMIVPLKLEEKVFGLVEVASFAAIQPHQIEFVERLGESIASTIASVKTNEQTTLLLHETQTQAEHMRAQEEEMRQNMEELTATQEEMQRILKEVQTQERYMNELIDSSVDSILVIDRSYKVISANKALKESYKNLGIEVAKGLDVSILFDGADWPKYRGYYDRTFSGETFQRTELFESHGFKLYFLSQHTPIRDNEGNVVASAVFAKDVTELVNAKKNAEKLASDQQHKNEELKAQEEELRQNMEELSATQDEMHRIILEVQNKEKYLSDIINVSNDIIFTVDREYKVISFNAAMEKGMANIGVSLEKGFCLLEIFKGNEKNIQKTFYDRAFSGECYDRTEHFTNNGLNVYSVVSYAPLKNAQGEIYAVVVFSKDVTEAQKTLLEVKQKELELNEIINASTDSIWTSDLQYKLVTFNKKFAEVFAARQISAVKGMDLIEVLQEHERREQRAIYDRVFAGESFEKMQTFTFGGTEVHILVTYSPRRNDCHEVIGAALYAKDVTTMVNAQRQTEELMKALKFQHETSNKVDGRCKPSSGKRNLQKKIHSRNSGL